MKRLSVLHILLALTLLYGCIKTDRYSYLENTPPEIFLYGDNPMIVTLNAMFEDPGATIKYKYDIHRTLPGIIKVIHDIPINGPVNGNGVTNTVGKYKVTYSYTDCHHNTIKKDRTVIVKNKSVNYAGTYLFDKTGGDNIFSNFDDLPTTIECDSFINNRVIFTKISNQTGLRVYADIIGDTAIFIPDQSVIFGNTPNGTLYRIRGEYNQSHVIDSISCLLSIKYQLEQYYETTSINCNFVFQNRYWESDALSINVEFYEKY